MEGCLMYTISRCDCIIIRKVIYVIGGSITFGLPQTGNRVALQAGDRLDLPAGVVHHAIVGEQGVLCLQTHQLNP